LTRGANDDDNVKGFIEISHPEILSRPSNEERTPQDRGIIDKVIDLTGEAFEKFGNLFRGESTEKKQSAFEPKQEVPPPSAHSSKLMKSERSHVKKPSGFME